MTLSAIAGGRATVFGALTVSFPGSYTFRASSGTFTSVTGGHYPAKVLSWGTLSYTISDRAGRLNAVETRITVADTDRTIARLVSGVYADSIRGSAATIKLATPTVASSSWATLFSGVVARISFPKPFEAEITIRTQDDQLLRVSPRGGWALTRVQWPNAKAEVFDKFAPVLYGYHDSSPFQTTPGLVPTLYVDTTQFRYLVCAGKAKSLTRVFKDGVQITSGGSTDYGGAFEYLTRNGRIYTCLKFTTDQGDAVFTIDALGYESVGDGSGSVITNPATIWAHRLTNFSLGDYLTGSWLSTNAIIDATSLSDAEAYFTSLGTGAHASVYDAERTTGMEITAAYCDSFRMRSFWTRSGTLATNYEDIFADPYGGTRLRHYREETGPFALREDDYKLVSRYIIRSAYSSSQDSYLQTLEVVDASVTNDTQESLDLAWSEAK
jgi:hypothetical protein